MSAAILNEIEETRRLVDEYYFRHITQLHAARSTFTQQFDQLASLLNAGASSRHEETGPVMIDALLTTPSRPNYVNDEAMLASPSMASPPVNRATLNYDHLLSEVSGDNSVAWQNCPGAESEADSRKRPTLDSIPEERRSRSPPKDRSVPCQVLVVFKRKRILQFESQTYVAPGEYVVVGGDRGEDIGLVTHSWTLGERDHNGEKKWGEGVGRVLRVASALEVSQLQVCSDGAGGAGGGGWRRRRWRSTAFRCASSMPNTSLTERSSHSTTDRSIDWTLGHLYGICTRLFVPAFGWKRMFLRRKGN
ncbi:putative cell cycle sequence binding phosphoprotein (RBP45) [Trypanosoma cruzi]|nr:putative cell cycle sequence binding phosphoprotein (RBP45) [Trypanosoma cruzi]